MSNETTKVTTKASTPGILFIIGLVLGALKLAGVSELADWSWWVVAAICFANVLVVMTVLGMLCITAVVLAFRK